jgi:hypothetical protein
MDESMNQQEFDELCRGLQRSLQPGGFRNPLTKDMSPHGAMLRGLFTRNARPVAPAGAKTSAPSVKARKGQDLVNSLDRFVSRGQGLTAVGLTRLRAYGLSSEQIVQLKELSQSAMTTLFDAIYILWQSGKLTESEFSEALSLILAGQNPEKGAYALVHEVERITFNCKRKQINEIRAFVADELERAAISAGLK